MRTAQSFKATKIPDQEVSYLNWRLRLGFQISVQIPSPDPNTHQMDADPRNPDPGEANLGSKKYLQRALGQIPAAAQVQGDQLAISLQNWFQNFIWKQ